MALISWSTGFRVTATLGRHRGPGTGRDRLDHVVALAGGTATWALGSYNTGPGVVASPTWTAVGVGTGVALFASLAFSTVGRRFQRRMRESKPSFAVVIVAGFFFVIWLALEADVTVRPGHYSWFLGAALSQLLGIALYLRQRAAG